MFQESQSATVLGIPALVFSSVVSALIGAAIALLSNYVQHKSSFARQKELLDEQFRQQESRLKHESVQQKELLNEQFRQQEARLIHDSEEKKLEREMIIRREILLSGVAAIGKMSDFLLSFGDINVSPEARNKIIESTGDALNKVITIANIETLTALDILDSYYKKHFSILIEKRFDLDNNIQYKKDLETSILNTYQRNQQLINLLSSQNSLTHNERNSIDAELQNNQSAIEQNQNSVDELNHTTVNQMLDLFKSSMEIAEDFRKLGLEMVLLVRKELNFPIDGERYEKMIEKSSRENMLHVTNFYESVIEKYRHEL